MGHRVSCTLRALLVSEDEQLVQAMGIVAYELKNDSVSANAGYHM